MSGQSGKTRAVSVAVTCEPKSSRANVAAAANVASSVNRWLAPRPPIRAGYAGPDGQEDEQADEEHRRGEVRRDRLAAVAEADGLAPEPRLEPDEHDRRERGHDERAAVAMVEDGEDRQAQDLEPDEDHDAAVDPLDPRLRVVKRREELAVAQRPVRAAQPGVGGAHDDADRDQRSVVPRVRPASRWKRVTGLRGGADGLGPDLAHSSAGLRDRPGHLRYRSSMTLPASWR